jgi:hypothetical protein
MAHGVRVPPGIEARGGCSVRSITGSGVRRGRDGGLGARRVGRGHELRMLVAAASGPGREAGDDARAVPTAGSKETEAAHQGVARWRHDRGEPGHQLHREKHHASKQKFLLSY